MNKLYYVLPIFIQHLLTSMYGYKLKKERYNTEYTRYYKEYQKRRKTKNSLLKNTMTHLKDNIEFYKEICISENNITETFFSLPITEKENLRTDLEIRSNKTKDSTVIKTGGTTGKSLKVYSSRKDKAKRMAYLDYIKSLHGVKPFSKRASFTGKEITPYKHKNKLWRYNIPMNQILYASFRLNKENVKHVFENLSKNKPIAIDGFPSSIHLIAKYILLNDINISWEVKAIFPTAENLTPSVKEDIEKAFKAPVIDQYASSEGAPFIFTGINGEYEIGHETGLFEFQKVRKGIYEMIVTSFINSATPIIRYKIGDRVMIESEKDYLNSFEDEIKIKKILGRDSEYLMGLNQNMVTSVNLANAIKELGDKIIQSQFTQKEIGVFDIKLVVSESFSKHKDEKVLAEKLAPRLGMESIYNFYYTSEIPKEKSGKTRFIINELESVL